MDVVQTSGVDEEAPAGPRVLVLGRNRWSLGTTGPTLFAAGIGALLGVATIALLRILNLS